MPASAPRARSFRRLPALVLVAAAATLAACSSSSSGSGTTTTSPGGGSTSAPSSSSASSKALQELDGLSSAVGHESKATFKATYTITSSASQTETLTVEQMPPDQLFSTTENGQNEGDDIFNGKNDYFCSNETPPSCIEYSSSDNPLSSLVDIVSGSEALTEIKDWQSTVEGDVMGYHLTESSQTFGGQSATCATWSYNGQSAKVCVTSGGVLAYSGSGTEALTLTAYSTSVSKSDFALPKGATISTIPTGT